MSFAAPKWMEQWRVLLPGFPPGDEQNGAFLIKGRGLKVIMSEGEGWQHASVSRRSKCPSYDDMEFIKRTLWGDDATVMQLHVPASDHVNNHEFCLHLWRPMDVPIPRPPAYMVGIKGLTVRT